MSSPPADLNRRRLYGCRLPVRTWSESPQPFAERSSNLRNGFVDEPRPGVTKLRNVGLKRLQPLVKTCNLGTNRTGSIGLSLLKRGQDCPDLVGHALQVPEDLLRIFADPGQDRVGHGGSHVLRQVRDL